MIVFIGLGVARVAWFQGEGLDVVVPHLTKGAVIEVDIMFTKENYSIGDIGIA